MGLMWSGALMLVHLGHAAGAAGVVDAIAHVLRTGGPRTPDLGGTATTTQVADAIAAALGGSDA
jgi:tartrate dehydrogenase/decarboxylase/D-malate dehydrogenase